MSKKYVHEDFYTSMEVAEIVSVPDQLIREWCEKERYPGAVKKENEIWHIPKRYFKVSLKEVRKRKVFEQELNRFNKFEGEVNEDESF